MSMAWDPEVDTPATIAVVGGGPIGVEAALYARFLGYDVLLFDAHKVAHRQAAWGDHSLEWPWEELTSSLGLAALEAQGSGRDFPAADERVTYRQYVDQYLLPVARTDLLYDSVQINSPVISISRSGCQRDSSISIELRAEQDFRLLIASQQRGEYSQLVDVILDCSGLNQLGGLASGCGIAVGETLCRSHMQCGKVDILGRQRASLLGQHVLLFGNDDAACANAIDMAHLAQDAPGTRTTWILPRRLDDPSPLRLPVGTSLELERAALELVKNNNTAVAAISAWGIESLQYEVHWTLRIQVAEDETLDVRGDRLINCQRPQPDWSFSKELTQPLSEPSSGLGAEPHYYVLGQKAAGESQLCSPADGRAQIRRVFALLGGREDLDLYETIRRQNAG